MPPSSIKSRKTDRQSFSYLRSVPRPVASDPQQRRHERLPTGLLRAESDGGTVQHRGHFERQPTLDPVQPRSRVLICELRINCQGVEDALLDESQGVLNIPEVETSTS